MALVYEYFMFAGKSSEDFQAHISGSGTYNAPQRDISNISVPGRNGDLHIDNGRYNNIDITYPAFITDDFDHNFSALKAFLSSQGGYKVLADSYHPDHFRLAAFKSALRPKMSPRNLSGSFDIVFDCDPRMFLKAGTHKKEFTEAGTIMNPTLYTALPLIRVYGTGSIRIGSVTVNITTANEYTDIDSEIEEAYKGSTNCNNNITLIDGRFPKLEPGDNAISMRDVTRMIITPRWWTV